jgi:hypothetical protein
VGSLDDQAVYSCNKSRALFASTSFKLMVSPDLADLSQLESSRHQSARTRSSITFVFPSLLRMCSLLFMPQNVRGFPLP